MHEKIRSEIKKHKSILTNEFKVRSLSLFGSYARNEQTPTSDIDLLVEFNETIDLFEFIRLENYLSEILDCPVDLILKDTLKPRIKDNILNQAIDAPL